MRLCLIECTDISVALDLGNALHGDHKNVVLTS